MENLSSYLTRNLIMYIRLRLCSMAKRLMPMTVLTLSQYLNRYTGNVAAISGRLRFPAIQICA